MAKYSFLRFLREQWGHPTPLVRENLTDKVVLVTEAIADLGFEVAKQVASMNPERLIIADRNEAKGKEAVKGGPYSPIPGRHRIKEATDFDNVPLFVVGLASCVGQRIL